MRPATNVQNEAGSAPDEAADVEAEAPTDKDAEGMDDDEDEGDEEIPGTQDDRLSLPILDSARVKVEEPDHGTTRSDDEV